MIGAARYFTAVYLAPRYWPKVGDDPTGISPAVFLAQTITISPTT